MEEESQLPQGLGCATRNMLGQRPAGTPRGTETGRLLVRNGWTLEEAMPLVTAVDTSLLESFF